MPLPNPSRHFHREVFDCSTPLFCGALSLP